MKKQILTLGCALLLLGSVFGSSPVKADSVVVCQSYRGRPQSCSINTRGGVRLIEQLSDTSCGGRWTYERGYVRVWDGCRAKFISYDGDDHNQNWDNNNWYNNGWYNNGRYNHGWYNNGRYNHGQYGNGRYDNDQYNH